MSIEQDHQLQYLDAEIQIAEKQLRIVNIRKQIVETELEVLAMHQELQKRINERGAFSLDGYFNQRPAEVQHRAS
jgi:hypothetical protein